MTKKTGRPPRPNQPCYTVHLVAPTQWLQDLKTYAKQHDINMNTVVLLAVKQYIENSCVTEYESVIQ